MTEIFRTALPLDIGAIMDGYSRLTADLERLEAAQQAGASLASLKADLEEIQNHAQRVSLMANVTASKIAEHLCRHARKVA